MSTAPTVARIMTRLVMTTSPDARVDQAARLLREWHVSGLPVIDEDGRVVGVISEKDIVRDLHKAAGVGAPRGLLDLLLESSPAKGENILAVCRNRLRNTRVREVMTKEVATVGPDTSLIESARLMKVNGVNRLPVVDKQERLVGIVTRADIVKDLSRTPPRARGSLHPSPVPTRTGTRPSDQFTDI
ncbi:MAG TPA: CBS domain-containing protein [Thermoplasmata archaeon]|nr:CBS domain-containing protein [Thermoplasmata archaeon]